MKLNSILRAASVALSAVLFVASLTACGSSDDTSSPASSEPAPSSVAEVKFENINPLTGENNLSTSALGQRPIAVMVNNNPYARPQWGLCDADVVIEGIVEGGCTRMMWLFSDISDVPKVGSLRSMRHDFVELALGFHAVLVHWGGSPQAYSSVAVNGVDDIDGMSDNVNFFRDLTRNVPTEHTGYATGKSVLAGIAQKGFSLQNTAADSSPFSFLLPNQTRVLTDGSCSRVDAYFSGAGYNHSFTYDAQEHLYYNSIEGVPMTDDNGKQMAVTNVIGLFMDVSLIAGDSSGRVDMDLSGGDGFYVSNGTYEKITWKKGNTPSNPLKLYDKTGKELTLNAGKSWIGLLPENFQSSTVLSE